MGKGGDGAVAVIGCGCFIFFAILTIVLVACSLEKVSSTEVGLMYNNVWGQLKPELISEGLKLKPTFGSIVKWPTDYKDVAIKGITCNSKDGIRIQLQASFQFVPKSTAIFNLTNMHKTFEEYEKLVVIQARSAMRHGCGYFTAQEFQTDRTGVQDKMNSEVTLFLLQNFQAEVKLLQLKNIERPAAYQIAVEDKETSRSDKKLAVNERAQQETLAQTAKDKSRQQALAAIDTATTQAAIVGAFAKADADAVKERYLAYATAYGHAKKAHKLTEAGVLAYFGNQMLGGKAGPSQSMAIPATAKISYKDEL